MKRAKEQDIKGFTFWRSYHEAAQILIEQQSDDEETDYSLYGHFIYQIAEYVLNGKEPDCIDPVEIALFIACRPNMDSTKEAVLAGINGARKKEEKEKSKKPASLVPESTIQQDETIATEEEQKEEPEETQEQELANAERKQRLYLDIWNNNADVFGFYSTIENPRAFKEFFRNKKVTDEYIETGMNNCIQAVKLGYYKQKFISSDPGKFVKQLHKFQKPYLPDDKKGETESNYDFVSVANEMMKGS